MNYIKYPRTYHLPYSLTITSDDKRLQDDDIFKSMNRVICSEKMDGENTTIYSNGYIHSRSITGNNHPWQSWIKKYSTLFAKNIPEGWRICGEDLYAKHSIEYHFNRESECFQLFGIFNEKNKCLSWKDILDWSELLQLEVVPVFYIGKYDKDKILEAFRKRQELNKEYDNETEGFVIRNWDSFKYEDFSKNVGKYVRANHLQTDKNWSSNWIKNHYKWNFDYMEDGFYD